MTVSRPWKMRSRRVRSWRPPTSMPTSSPSSASSSHDCSSTARRPSPTRGRPSIWSPRRASGNPEPMDNFITPRASSAPAPGAIEPLLCLRGIGKCYAAPVLKDVDLDLLPGEVHALMGANGAGKSTLACIISGLVQPDAGSMMLERSSYRPAGKAAAESLGVMKPVKPDQRLWYRRTFELAPPRQGQRWLLHCGAVDWDSTVIFNGRTLGTHR